MDTLMDPTDPRFGAAQMAAQRQAARRARTPEQRRADFIAWQEDAALEEAREGGHSTHHPATWDEPAFLNSYGESVLEAIDPGAHWDEAVRIWNATEGDEDAKVDAVAERFPGGDLSDAIWTMWNECGVVR